MSFSSSWRGYGKHSKVSVDLTVGTPCHTSEIATFTANVIGSFIIGLLIASTKGEVYLFAAIGFCGGFTTFSTFSAQTIQLFQNGQRIEGIIYIAASVICALIFVGLGLYIGGKFLK